MGFFVGMAVSGVIKKKFGYVTNFVLGIVGSLIALLYTVFFLKDSRSVRQIKQLGEVSLSLPKVMLSRCLLLKKNCLFFFYLKS